MVDSDPALERLVIESVDSHQKAIVHFLQQLIRAPSLTGREALCATVCADKLRDLDLEVDLWAVDGAQLRAHPAANPSRFPYEGRPNVVGRWRGAVPKRGQSLMLNGHTDVVTAEPVTQWAHDPWGGEVRDGRLYGRGSSDMKGGIAAMIVAVEALKAAGIRLAGDVLVECVIEEEEGVGNGTLASLLRGYTADACIVTEPTDLAIQPSMRGAVRFEITVEGQSTHGTKKWDGVDAIEKGFAVWSLLQPFQDAMSVLHEHPLYRSFPISIPVTVDMVRAGAWRGMVAPDCVIEGYLETLPGRDTLFWEDTLRTYLRSATKTDPWLREHPPLLKVTERYEAYAESPDNPFVMTVDGAVQAVTRRPMPIIGFNAGCDAYIRHVYGRTPTVMFGPGGGNAHGADEWVSVDDLITATKALALTMVRWCGVA